MKKLFVLFAAASLSFGVLACDFGEDEDVTEYEEVDDGEEVGTEDPDVELTGPCVEGDSAGIVYVRLTDNPNNSTLLECSDAGNPGADIDAVVLVRPDGTEYFAATVEEDIDNPGGQCEKNDKADMNAVLGMPDACVKELGCGCGDDGYDMNPECDCAGGDSKYVGYYSMNGGSIIVSFDGGAEVLCKDEIVVYEMWNADVAGTEEGYTIHYGDANGNYLELADVATGIGSAEVEWEW